MRYNIIKNKYSIFASFLIICAVNCSTQTPAREFAKEEPAGLNIQSGKFIGFSPAISADGRTIIFESDILEKYNYKIYMSQIIGRSWSKPYLLDKVNFNSNAREIDAGPFITFDQNSLLITSTKDGGIGDEDIWISHRSGKTWQKPVNMGKPVNSKGYDGFASLSPDGCVLYYTRESLVKKSLTGCGFHIVFSRKIKGKWTEPEIIPYPVNSGYCEFGPRILADGKTLIFSSDRPEGFGEYDLYKTVLDEEGDWSYPENLGSRINTELPEMIAAIPASGDIIFFSRKSDIYTGQIFSAPVDLMGENSGVITLTGAVRDARNPSETLFAKITITDIKKDTEQIIIYSNENDGKYIVILNMGYIYDVSVEKEGYLFYSKKFDLKESKKFEEINEDILLEPVRIGAKIILENIYFEFDKYELLPESKYELNRIITLMNQNPYINVEISGHTDNLGEQDYNLELSYKRSESVSNYLIKHGIKAKRLASKGYGCSKPIDSNDTNEGRSKNRRVEFKILGIETPAR